MNSPLKVETMFYLFILPSAIPTEQYFVLLTICQWCWKILWIRFCQLSRWEAMKEETSWPGPDYFPYKSFCSCHYPDVAPVFYSVNFLERLSRAAKDILLCQMFRLLLSLCPGKHLSFFGSIAAMLALMPASVPGMFKEALLKQKGWMQRECE